MRREENRKRLLRERVRAEVYTIGRIMRNVRFANFNYDLLLRSHEILRVLLDSWNEDMDEGKTCGNSDESVPQRGSGEASVGTSLPWNASTVNANGQDTDNKEDSANVTDTVLTGSSRKKSMVKRSVYCHVSPAVKAPQEPREEGHTDPALPRREPLAVTRLGRVVKRKKILDL
ncbi:hypothetical protein Y032_0022g510 [Ancylostoma ceylanicum]|nr:hypothetical protein Y032_0022g510 [Ancylostoma ceylanicum]